MAVVAAGVHAAGVLRAEAVLLRVVIGRVAFVDGQGVHVHAQDGGRAGFAAIPVSDDGGVAVFERVKEGGIGTVFACPGGMRGGGRGVRFAHDGGLAHHLASQAQAVAEAHQFGGNAGCGADFEEALFGIAVEVAPPGEELWFEGVGHGGSGQKKGYIHLSARCVCILKRENPPDGGFLLRE